MSEIIILRLPQVHRVVIELCLETENGFETFIACDIRYHILQSTILWFEGEKKGTHMAYFIPTKSSI